MTSPTPTPPTHTRTKHLRDFENLAFRLGLEESKEMMRGRDLDVLGVETKKSRAHL